MTCYIVRHGKDDETVRGGWSQHSLITEGIEQTRVLGTEMAKNGVKIRRIYSSDIQRAKETALILQESLNCPIEYRPEFREANNGYLAGLKHDIADTKFPGVYWTALDYTERYPGGESPAEFFQRIQSAWSNFKHELMLEADEDVLLVTHGGVLQAILCIENEKVFSNKVRHFATPSTKLFPIIIK